MQDTRRLEDENKKGLCHKVFKGVCHERSGADRCRWLIRLIVEQIYSIQKYKWRWAWK